MGAKFSAGTIALAVAASAASLRGGADPGQGAVTGQEIFDGACRRFDELRRWSFLVERAARPRSALREYGARERDGVVLRREHLYRSGPAGGLTLQWVTVLRPEGLWDYFPGPRVAIKILTRTAEPDLDEAAGAARKEDGYNLLLKGGLAEARYETIVADGTACYVVTTRRERVPSDGWMTGIYRRAVEWLSRPDPDRIAKIAYIIGRDDRLIRRKTSYNSEGSVLADLIYKDVKADPDIDAAAFDLPLGFTEFRPKSQEECASLVVSYVERVEMSRKEAAEANKLKKHGLAWKAAASPGAP